MRPIFPPFLILAILFFGHGFLARQPLGLVVPDKVIPALLKDAFFTPHLLGYLALGLAGYGILLFCMAAIAAWLGRAINQCAPLIRPRLCSLVAAVLLFVSLLCANTIFFPHSTAAIPQKSAWLFLVFSLSLITGVSFWYALFLVRNKKVRHLLEVVLPALFILWAALPVASYGPGISLPRAWAAARPTNPSMVSGTPAHVILIGIDSLRPDYTSLFGNRTTTPEVNAFLKNAVAFPETYTPIARTFPAWTTILTGRYPWEIGVPFNLTQATPSAVAKAFPHTFQRAGYRTLFVSDEKRFSNIDESFGFEEVAGPVTGVADFLLGSFNDTALANLFVNSTFGRWFFPFSHANRAAYATYAPKTFIRLLGSRLPTQPQRPHFLAVHLCLPHHPFLWKDTPLKPIVEGNSKTAYELSLTAADEQFGAILQMLGEKGYLENAWVVLLSDHGEGLGEPLTAPLGALQPERSAVADPLRAQKDQGHGTSVLSVRQHRVMLAFRHYGAETWQGGERKQPAILADILPTVMKATGIFPPPSGEEDLQGISLLRAIRSHHLLAQRPIFFETGLNPSTITMTGGKMSTKDITAGMALYSVAPSTGRLLLKPEVVAKEKKEKDYGMIQEGRFLGLLAPDSRDKRHLAYRASPEAPLAIHEGPEGLPAAGQTMWQVFQQQRLGL